MKGEADGPSVKDAVRRGEEEKSRGEEIKEYGNTVNFIILTKTYTGYRKKGVIKWEKKKRTSSAEKCTKQSVLTVEKNVKFLSSLTRTDLFIAGTVSGNTGQAEEISKTSPNETDIIW